MTYPSVVQVRIGDMDDQSDFDSVGLFDSRYRSLLDTMNELRPSLHRYCARMTGSVMDGEDIVQEALFEAYRKLDKYDESRPMKPWLFGVAHNRCVDFLRRKKICSEAEEAAGFSYTVEPADPAHLSLGPAVERLVTSLPPMERACVLLKDVFDYSLEEISELVGSTVGGVKSALNRGRAKLSSHNQHALLKPSAEPYDTLASYGSHQFESESRERSGSSHRLLIIAARGGLESVRISLFQGPRQPSRDRR